MYIEICALLGCQAAYSGNFLPTFRDKLFLDFLNFKGLISCLENSVNSLPTFRDNLTFPSSRFKKSKNKVVLKHQQGITTTRCVIFQKRADII